MSLPGNAQIKFADRIIRVIASGIIFSLINIILLCTFVAADQTIELTTQEQEWIKKHPVISLAIDNTYPPLNYMDDEGKLVGLSVDYIDLFAKKIGVSIDYKGSIWSIAIKKALNHEVDGIVNADATEKRKSRLNFTKPYVTLPSGLVTLKKAPILKSINDMDGQSICVKSNSSHLALISQKTKALIFPIETVEEGLEKVIKGEASGVFDDVSVLGYLIAKYNFVSLKINMVHHDNIVGVSRLGLRKNDPVMLAVINKAILSMTKEEKRNVQSKWLSLAQEKTIVKKQFDWGVFFKITGPVLTVILILTILILLHNKRLRHVVEIRTRDLKKSEEQFKTLIDHAADAVFVHDMKGRFVVVNQQACQSLGYGLAELLEMSVTDVESGEWNLKELEEIWRSLVPGKAVTLEGLHKCKNSKVFPVENRIGVIEIGGVRSVLVLARDITERKKVQQNQSLLADVIEQSHETVLITDKVFTIQYVNKAFEMNTGYSKEEVIGRTSQIFNSGKHSKEFYSQMWSAISKGNVWTGLLVNKRKDGGLLEEDTTILPVKDGGGEIINYAMIMRDVTQERTLERRLSQAQKMEAIGTLAGGIAHDFNNILSAIIGYTELSQDISEEKQVQGYLDEVFKAGNRAKGLVQQILTFSRQTEQQLNPLSVKLIAKEAIKLLRASLPSTIEILDKLESESLIMADTTQIHQIFMNLCTNAGQAMQKDGGILAIELTDVVLDSNFTAHDQDLEPGKYIKLSIRDTGHGLSQKDQGRIFDPFFTTKEKGEGTGLGLAVVHGIVKSYKGIISVYSEQGRGAEFKIFLPVINKMLDSDEGIDESLMEGTGMVLFVDDEPALVEIGKQMLEGLGYQVVVSTSSREALEIFKKEPKLFDLVITDMTMPGMTGENLAKELMAIRRDLPVLLCTGFSSTMTENKAREMGLKGLLIKPVVRSELSQKVSRILGEARPKG